MKSRLTRLVPETNGRGLSPLAGRVAKTLEAAMKFIEYECLENPTDSVLRDREINRLTGTRR